MPSNTDRLRTALADQYRIERELGSGGMATVFLAEDLKHHRKVAIKVLRSDLAASLGADRFLREIQIAAQLQHPHILPLFDSGQVVAPPLHEVERGTGGEVLLYYVMPYVDGESLRDRLARDTELPVAEAVRILRDVVDALVYAHERGVVHRDIKPDNIMLSGNHAAVTDFGVAKAVSEATGRQHVTTAGVALGTPTYMAPEQASADPNIDHRADIYAIGTVAYELLTGRPPFAGKTAQGVLAAHVMDAPEHVSTHRPAVSPVLGEVVMRCLEKKPADRFQTTGELLTRLESLATPSGGMEPTSARPAVAPSGARRNTLVAFGVVTLVASAAAIGFASRGGGADGPAGVDDPRRVAVLLFQNLSREEEDEFFTDGITQDISVQLSKVGDFRVTAHGSASRFKSGETDYVEAAAALNADYLVDGSVRRAGDRLRISVSLVDPGTGDQLWAEDYSRDLSAGDIFGVQRDVARQVAQALGATLGPENAGEGHAVPTANLEAYTIYLRGRYFWNQRSEVGLLRAVDEFSRAIALDSTYALAYSGLADAYTVLPFYGTLEPVQGAVSARRAATRAVGLDSLSAEAHASLGLVMHTLDWDWTGAERTYRRAIQLDPGYASAHQWYAGLLFTLGRFDEAIAEARVAHELDPLSRVINQNLGDFLTGAGNPTESIALLQRAVQLDTTWASGWDALGRAFIALDSIDRAISAFRRGGEVHRIYALALGGERARAIEAIRVLRRAREALNWSSPLELASAYLAVDDTLEALALLEDAVAVRDPRVAYYNLSIFWWRPLYGNPRFQAALEPTGLSMQPR